MVGNPAPLLVGVLDRFTDFDCFVGGVGVLCEKSSLLVLRVKCETTGTCCTIVLATSWCLRRKDGFLPTSTDVSL